MSKQKASVVYVAPIPKEQSGIGQDVPEHVKLEWTDEDGRRCTRELQLCADDLSFVAQLPETAMNRTQELQNECRRLREIIRFMVENEKQSSTVLVEVVPRPAKGGIGLVICAPDLNELEIGNACGAYLHAIYEGSTPKVVLDMTTVQLLGTTRKEKL